VTNAGIYQIRALHSGEIYIGSSTNLEQRKHDHFRFLRYGNHKNPKLQNSYNKYGPDNFVFEVLVTCEPENCLEYEQEHFDRLNPEFNIIKQAGWPPSRKGKYVVHSEKAKKNMTLAAQARGKKQREESFKKNLPIYEAIKQSGLSVRKFCALNNLMPNRTSYNAGYKKYLEYEKASEVVS